MATIRTGIGVTKRGSKFTLDARKLRAVITYFLGKKTEGIGKTKLMKLLYFADFENMRRHNEPITGAQYVKWPQGPVPPEALDALKDLYNLRIVAEKRQDKGNYVQHTQILVGEPEQPNPLSPRDKKTLEYVWGRWGGLETTDIVEASHQQPPWLSVPMGVEIPYHTALYD